MGIRTGRRCLDSCATIGNGSGERISDIVSHPRLGPAARTLAEFYDLQYRADLSEHLCSLAGHWRSHRSHLYRAHLGERFGAAARGGETWMDWCGGMMGPRRIS